MARRLLHFADPVPEAPACEKHPEWTPPRRMAGLGRVHVVPPPPASMCPYCRREAEERQAKEREMLEVPHPLQVHDTPRLNIAADRYETLAHARGQVLPGTPEETEALERIDELREEELARLGDTFANRRKRARRYWRKAGAASLLR